MNPSEFEILPRALSQRTEIKIKKQNPMFTKDEIETTVHALSYIITDEGYTLKCRNEAKSMRKKLNNQLKELL